MVEDSVPLRSAIIKLLEADPVLTELCGGRIYGPRQPAETEWPFIRYGAPIVTPDEASGWTGGRHRVTIHTFARGPDETECAKIAARIDAVLDEAEFSLVEVEGLGRDADVFELFSQGTQLLPDGPVDWHGVSEFNATVGGA